MALEKRCLQCGFRKPGRPSALRAMVCRTQAHLRRHCKSQRPMKTGPVGPVVTEAALRRSVLFFLSIMALHSAFILSSILGSPLAQALYGKLRSEWPAVWQTAPAAPAALTLGGCTASIYTSFDPHAVVLNAYTATESIANTALPWLARVWHKSSNLSYVGPSALRHTRVFTYSDRDTP